MPFADPNKARDYQREYRRTRRAGDSCTTPVTTPLPLSFRLKTADDVLQLLEERRNVCVRGGELAFGVMTRCA
jgi:hypothetical protein